MSSSKNKILIYGFQPFKSYRTNITQDVLTQISESQDRVIKIFPVKFDKSQFQDVIKKEKPSLIIGTGQCPRGAKIRIERKAFNQMRDNKQDVLSVINPGGPQYLFSTLPIKIDKDSRISYSAGRYVCNYSMYICMEYIRDNQLNIPYTFLHIPKDFKIDFIKSYLLNLIGELSNSQLK